MHGDEQYPELWQEMEMANVAAILLDTPDQDNNVRTTKFLRDLGFDGPINALIRDAAARQSLLEAGATTVSLPMTQAGEALVKASLQRGVVT